MINIDKLWKTLEYSWLTKEEIEILKNYYNSMEKENKQLRIALQECRKALEEEITAKKKAIEYIKEELYEVGGCIHGSDLPHSAIEPILEILGDKENE